MNSIGKRQNDEKYLLLQYSARFYYNRAEILNYLVWITCIGNTIISILPLSGLKDIKIPIIFGLSVLSIYMQFLLKKYVEIASSMRKYIDYHLFKFENLSMYNNYNEDKLIEIAINVKKKNPAKASIQFRNTGTDKPCGVRDWYTGINPNDDKYTAILNCQKINAFFNRELTDLYIKTIKLICVIVFITLIVVFSKDSIIDLICFLMSIPTLIIKIICECAIISHYKKISIAIEALLEASMQKIDNKYLIEIQNRIDQRRSIPFLVPNLLHKINTKKLHAISSEGVKMK